MAWMCLYKSFKQRLGPNLQTWPSVNSPEVRTFLNLKDSERSASSDDDEEVENLNNGTDVQTTSDNSSSMESLNRVDLGPSERKQ